jgi:hypothetical protein
VLKFIIFRFRLFTPPLGNFHNVSSAALGGRLTGDSRGTLVRARVAKATQVVGEGGRQEEPLAAPIVEIPVTCYQVNGSSSWSILWIAISKMSSPSVV